MVATADGPQTDQTLTGAEIAALGLPVWYIEGDAVYTHDHRLDGAQAVAVYLGRRKTGPLLAAVPHAQPYDQWARARFDADSAGWTDIERIAAAVDAQNYWHSDRTRLALAADVADKISPNHPLHGVFLRLAEIETARRALTAQHAAVMQRASGLGVVSAALREVSGLLRTLNTAYPLIEHLRSSTDGDHYKSFVDYLVHTPPRPSADDSTARAA